jgi:hypothetical protein
LTSIAILTCFASLVAEPSRLAVLALCTFSDRPITGRTDHTFRGVCSGNTIVLFTLAILAWGTTNAVYTNSGGIRTGLAGQALGAACFGRFACIAIHAFGGSVFVRGIGVDVAKLASRRTFDIVVFSFDTGNARRLFGQRLGIPKWALLALI